MNSRIAVSVVAALGTGVAIALQSTLSGRTGGIVGPIRTGFLINAIGGSMAILVVAGFFALTASGVLPSEITTLQNRAVPVSRLLGWIAAAGALGILIIMGVALSVQGVGVTAGLSAIIVAQLIAGLLIDRVGGAGGGAIALDWRRIVGVLLMFAGVWVLIPRR